MNTQICCTYAALKSLRLTATCHLLNMNFLSFHNSAPCFTHLQNKSRTQAIVARLFAILKRDQLTTCKIQRKTNGHAQTLSIFI